MSIGHSLVLVSVLISSVGAFAYIRDTLTGKTKPNRVSYGLWAIAPLIGTAAAISSGADTWATVRIFLAGFIPLLIFFASFINPKSYWKLTHFDFLCGVSSLVAIIVWLVLDAPVIAILFAAIGDGFAGLPTIVKAWKYPETETGLAYVTSLISVILVIPAIPVWNIENAAFQVYLLTINTLLLIAVYRKQLGFRTTYAD
jgi:hypothetical protein